MSCNIFNVQNRIALITGSSRGLGLYLAEGLASFGVKVVLNGRDTDALGKAVVKLKSKGYNASGYAFDITNQEEVNKSIKCIEKDIGQIDILINNAGVQIRNKLEEFSLDDWNKVLNINLTGAFIVTREVVRGMIERRKGKIINICSLQSELGRQTIAPYAASKGGLKMLTRAMCVEWAQYNIQANAIGPGYFKTEMTRKLWENVEFDNWLKSRTPANRWGNPDELIGTAVFLASDASDFINGQIIYVDGGILAAI